ncbi:uncharacterized protein MONOS_13328 [Monocercomonoides exilis]|uniref:uncharacterized protein n=1 Tax=Monocercomonoides exilis TaxID=2049356 RepID=UPI003559CDD8|nr:hypothetical protein MONOS_13328 [Monocercomonoides exilis]|eukprot:MONOS_13328.1-p1 / transcript=MONOS_13328.1 / gene=MONOS_13328 / organism=Monocercomonoides_exilis_PA203 / gene_product=unspecified product / transcript_product=unspecified product / location=Mono_scaffold00809:11315-13733(+) / protein_length=544 / sequence_SO=supercontig / SO=protein_coding / is_pseudo=false
MSSKRNPAEDAIIVSERLDAKNLGELIRVLRDEEGKELETIRKLCMFALRKKDCILDMVSQGLLSIITTLMKDRPHDELFLACSDLLCLISNYLENEITGTGIPPIVLPLLALLECPNQNVILAAKKALLMLIPSSSELKAAPHGVAGPGPENLSRKAVTSTIVYSGFVDRLPALLDPLKPGTIATKRAALEILTAICESDIAAVDVRLKKGKLRDKIMSSLDDLSTNENPDIARDAAGTLHVLRTKTSSEAKLSDRYQPGGSRMLSSSASSSSTPSSESEPPLPAPPQAPFGKDDEKRKEDEEGKEGGMKRSASTLSMSMVDAGGTMMPSKKKSGTLKRSSSTPAITIPVILFDDIIAEVDVRRDLSFKFPDVYHCVQKENKVLAVKKGTTSVIVNKIIDRGIWYCEFVFTNIDKQQTFGLCHSNFTAPADYRPGRDKNSAGYYGVESAPLRQDGRWTLGNSRYNEGDQVGVQVDMTAAHRTAHFFVKGKQQPNYFVDIPESIRFMALVSIEGSSFEVTRLLELPASQAIVHPKGQKVAWRY